MPIIGNKDTIPSNSVQTSDIQDLAVTNIKLAPEAVTADKISPSLIYTATGGGTDKVFYLNGKTITTNYTVPSGQNAISAGPITISDGVTVTVSDNSSWVIV